MDIYNNYLKFGLGKSKPSEEKIKQFQKNYSRYFPANKNARILDIGPGKGEMLLCLSKNGYKHVEAIDISDSVVEYCKDIGFNNVYKCDIVDYSNEENRYDMITMCDVVEHIAKDNICDIVTTLYHALKKDGILIIQTPNMQSITSSIFLHDDFTHVCGYTERSLTQMLLLCGFQNVKCSGFELLDQSLKSSIQRFFRNILWICIKIIRKINGTMPHKILHPIFFAVATKE